MAFTLFWITDICEYFSPPTIFLIPLLPWRTGFLESRNCITFFFSFWYPQRILHSILQRDLTWWLFAKCSCFLWPSNFFDWESRLSPTECCLCVLPSLKELSSLLSWFKPFFLLSLAPYSLKKIAQSTKGHQTGGKEMCGTAISCASSRLGNLEHIMFFHTMLTHLIKKWYLRC